MSVIAIIGAGPLGSAIAHKLANRGRIRDARLIDPAESIARGKALDILQSGPVENFTTGLTASGSLLSAAGADVIVLADSVEGLEHAGEPALTLLRQLVSAGITSPVVFAGAGQRELMSRATGELRIPTSRVLGSAPLALASALRAIAALAIDTSPVEITLNVFGVPPRHAVVAWQEATVSGQPLASVMGAHHIAAVTSRVASLWPPGPYALASAAARVAEAACFGSRRTFSCFVDVGNRRIAAMPVELHPGGIRRVVQPSLTTVERTALETAIESNG